MDKEEDKNAEKWDNIIQEIGISEPLEAIDDECDDDNANGQKSGDNEIDGDDVEFNTNQKDDGFTNDVADELANDKIDQTRWEDGGEESKSKTNSPQLVVQEVPLKRSPHQNFSLLPSAILNSVEGEKLDLHQSCISDDLALMQLWRISGGCEETRVEG